MSFQNNKSKRLSCRKNNLFKQTASLFFAFVFCLNTFGEELPFNSITVNDGLSQHDVSCILQDSHGFMWVGTYDGLNRFDGFKVLNFLHETENVESLSSNRITCLFEDSKQRIWIGTDGSGLNFYSLLTEKFVRIKTPPRFNLINSISENENGEIYVATGNGVLKIIEDEKPVAEIVQLPVTGLSVRGFLISSDNTFYFATNKGVWVWKNNICKQLKECGNKQFSVLVEDENRKIWAAGSATLKIIDPYGDSNVITEPEGFSGLTIRTLCNAKNSSIWLGTLNSGLLEIDASNYKIKNRFTSKFGKERGLLSNTVLSLYLDKTNTLWAGNRKGLCYTSLTRKKFNTLPLAQMRKLALRPHIRNLFIDGSDVFISSQNRGCFHYSIETSIVQEIKSTKKIEASNFSKFNNRIYIAASDGVYVQEGSSLSFSKLIIDSDYQAINNPNVHSMCNDTFGNIYYGSVEGLIIQKGNRAFWIHDEYEQATILQGKRIFSLYFDELDNCIWIGTISEGLYKLNLTDTGDYLSMESYDQSMLNNYYIANNTIWCFYKDSKKTLWIGTDAGLLMKTHNSNQFTQIKVDGVLDKKIMGIVEDTVGNLWLSNSQGLICYNPTSEKARRYAYNDGLNSSTLTEAVGKTADGTLFFGGINGINYFNPTDINDNPYTAEVAISDFRVHNNSIVPGQSYLGSTILGKSINLTTNIKLNYRQNNFIFEFAGTNYANASENKFKYKLEGYDADWVYTAGTHRFAPYSNLKQGTYTFLIDAANHDGIWSDNPRKITIDIIPPPWLSYWAYMAYFVIISSIILSFIYFLRNRQKLQHTIELDNVQRKKEKEINELKLIFFTDVAHEFKTPLSLIIGPLNELIQNKLTAEHRDFCFKIVSRNTKRMMFLVNQLLDFRKLNANKNILKITESDLSEFIHTTTKAFMWQAKNEEINFNVIKPELFQCFFDRDVVEKVVYNLLSNAFKYTPKNGIVEIEVKPIWKKDIQIANIILRDSGSGIPNEEKNKIFERYFHGKDRSSSGIGLHLSSNLIKAHKGEINVADSSYGGTEFIVTIPVSKNSYEDIEFFEVDEQNEIADDLLSEMEIQKKDIGEERESILIVEDDHDLRSYLKNCLHVNYKVFEAQNGMEGFIVATDNLPDIIISDVMMPEMDGIEMCKKLKDNNETSHIPILMLTAKTAQEQQNEGLEAGAWDYISKPFNTEALLKKINNIVESRNRFRETMINRNISVEIKKHYTPYDQKLIAKATKIIEDNMGNENFSVEDFAMEIGLSRMQLHRKLTSLVGHSATEFINTIRIQFAAKMFDQGCDRINEAMDAIGISSYSHFNKLFKKVKGKTASEYIEEKKHSE